MVGQVEDVETAGNRKKGHRLRHEVSKSRSKGGTEQHDREETRCNAEEVRQRPSIAVIEPHGMAADRIRARSERGDEGEGEGGKNVYLHTTDCIRKNHFSPNENERPRRDIPEVLKQCFFYGQYFFTPLARAFSTKA